MDRRQVLQFADDNTDFNYVKFKVLNYWYYKQYLQDTLQGNLKWWPTQKQQNQRRYWQRMRHLWENKTEQCIEVKLD